MSTFRLYALAVLLTLAACRPQQPTDRAAVMPDTLPFAFATDPAHELDPAQAAAEARRIRSSVDAHPADGLELSVWATEDLIEDPIALDVADNGDLYVTVSSRAGGLLDIRGHMGWTHEALAMETVGDHEDFLKRELSPERSDSNEWLPDFNEDGSRDWRDLTVNHDYLYRVNDASGDGVADRARVVASGFNSVVHDLLGGIEIHDGSIYVSAAPGLYRLDDALGDESGEGSTVSWGYNIHPGFNGHGMSGVIVGPDGRLYWGVGDMGLSVVAPDGTRHHYPHQGAILRSFPDGSGFEVFATGLRNTHEFVFDAHGNLISVDNDGDHPGEMERIVYIVEGSDSGWRVHWQFGKYTDEKNNEYKVWMDEELFKPRFEGQAAYITPPISNYHSGPAGMAYNPGTALSDEWTDRFFISEYTGSPATTNVHAFQLEPSGAGFELAGEQVAASGVLTVGLGFGPDGALYLADWIDGWRSKGAGRIWKLDVANPDTAARTQTRELLTADYETASTDDLYNRLGHPDLRIRRKAQFELARRGDAETLLRAAQESDDRLTRLHGIWGIWQRALQNAQEAEALIELLGDTDAEVRAQAAKVLGDLRYERAAEELIPLLGDTSDRVRFFAAQALGRVEHRPAFGAILEMIEANAGEDVYLRHAGSLAMARIGDPEAIVDLTDHPSEAVRLAAVIALRRMKHEGVAAFLSDDSEQVVTEAARAINDDGGIQGALPALAALLDDVPFENEPLLRRVISANLRVGSAAAAQRAADYAVRSDAPDTVRAEAVSVLGVWPSPSILDRVDGAYLGRVDRDTAIARQAASDIVEPLLAEGPVAVREAVAIAVARLRIEEAARPLMARLRADASADVRRASLEALIKLTSPDDAEVMRVALADDDPAVRMRALRLVSAADLDEEEVAGLLGTAVRSGSVTEKQSALAALGDLDTRHAREALAREMDLLEAGRVEPEIRLDVIEAAAASGSDSLAARAAAYRDAAEPFSAALYGGDADEGEEIFYDHDGAQCARCHSIGGGDGVGPDLASIGSRLTREQLLESLVEPAARIAPGFGTVGGPSAMPNMSGVLTAREIRDVVAYLASLE